MALASMSEIFERMARNGQEFWEVVLADDMDERQVSREASMAKMLTTWQAMQDAADSYTGRKRSVRQLILFSLYKNPVWSVIFKAFQTGFLHFAQQATPYFKYYFNIFCDILQVYYTIILQKIQVIPFIFKLSLSFPQIIRHVQQKRGITPLFCNVLVLPKIIQRIKPCESRLIYAIYAILRKICYNTLYARPCCHYCLFIIPVA